MTDALPSPDTFPTQREFAEGVARTRNRILTERVRNHPPGKMRKCPRCAKRTLAGRDDLQREVKNRMIVHRFRNLHGARCTTCGTELLEAYEQILLEDAESQFTPDYQARVANVAGKNLGTYWPKDVVRVMGLHAKDSLRVQVLDQDTMVIHREHNHSTD